LLVNGSLAANASCTISLDLQVTATTAGSLTSPAVTLSSNQAPNATAAAINLTVTVPAPTFTMAFDPSTSVAAASGNATGTLTFTITNNAAIQLTGLAFEHTFPAPPNTPPLQIAAGAAFIPSCGSPTLTATAGTAVIRFTGGRVAPGQTCIVDIPVQVAVPATATSGTLYTYVNNPVRLTSEEAAPVTVGPVIWRVRVQ